MMNMVRYAATTSAVRDIERGFRCDKRSLRGIVLFLFIDFFLLFCRVVMIPIERMLPDTLRKR